VTKRLLFTFLFVFAVFISFPKNIFAAIDPCTCSGGGIFSSGTVSSDGCSNVGLYSQCKWTLFGGNSCQCELPTCECNKQNKVTSNKCAAGGAQPTCFGGDKLCVCGTPLAGDTDSLTISCTVDGNVGVYTALGCIPVQMDKFVAWLLPYLFGIGGGIAFILMIVGFIQMTTSQGDPKAVQGARETITSAIVGLLICILAIFLLRLITVNILHIPGIS
jgi:hypothetical protein